MVKMRKVLIPDPVAIQGPRIGLGLPASPALEHEHAVACHSEPCCGDGTTETAANDNRVEVCTHVRLNSDGDRRARRESTRVPLAPGTFPSGDARAPR